MSAPPGQPFQSHGFQTSVDLVSNQPYYDVSPLAGHKRPPGYPPSDPPQPSGLKQSLRPQSLATNQGIATHLRSDDFVRPSVAPGLSRLVASEIRPVTAAVPAENLPRVDTSVPGPSQDPLLSLRDPRYGLSPTLVANFAALGVNSIYPWQASCLLSSGLLTGERHLVYTAPTGGGKSLVADVLMLKRIIENPSRKAILVLPYVALVQEKLKWLRRIVHDVEKHIPDSNDDALDSKSSRRWKKLQKSIRVTGFFGGSKTTASWADTDIAVCTIEKVWLFILVL